MTGAVGWRKDNIKYKKNEVFLDIVEQVNVLMSNKGVVLRSDVNGKVVMKVFLSGMPDVRLGLNDKLEVRASGLQPRCLLQLYCKHVAVQCGLSPRHMVSKPCQLLQAQQCVECWHHVGCAWDRMSPSTSASIWAGSTLRRWSASFPLMGSSS